MEAVAHLILLVTFFFTLAGHRRPRPSSAP
jgi:hypothetical protein